ncbi:MAG: alpha amylase C-terminal domain-containing protein, partial [Acidobacteria bacterium]|nr:alpha amylase C-terminal domain-containing protein [Acidobacteriota bacterium]
WSFAVERVGIDFHDVEGSVVSFVRKAEDPKDFLLFCCNFTPVVRENYGFGVPEEGFYQEVLNTDSEYFGGSNLGNGVVSTRAVPMHGRKQSISITLPALAVLVFKRH